MNIQEEVGEEIFGTSSSVEKIAMCFTHDLNSKQVLLYIEMK